MPMPFLDGIDLRRTALINALLDPRSSAPSTPAVGQAYFNTTSMRPFIYWASAWHDLLDAFLLEGHSSAWHLDRTHHSGTQLAATISDLAATVLAYRLDQFAVPTAPINLNGQRVTNAGAPTAASDLVTRQFVENRMAGLRDFHESARLVVGSDVDVFVGGLLTLGSVTLTNGDRVLLIGQDTASENGIWLARTGAWERAPDADESAEVSSGLFLYATAGAGGADPGGYVLATADPITLDLTDLLFAQFAGAGGDAALLNGHNAAYYLDRTHHTGQQPRASISDLYDASLSDWQPPTAPLDIDGQRIFNVGQPLGYDDEAATLRTAQEWGQLRWALIASEDEVDIATGGFIVLDGATLFDGARILLMGQDDAEYNGLYLARAGAWERAPDANISEKIAPGQLVYVCQGNTYGGRTFQLKAGSAISLDNSSLHYERFDGLIGAGYGLTEQGGMVELDPAFIGEVEPVRVFMENPNAAGLDGTETVVVDGVTLANGDRIFAVGCVDGGGYDGLYIFNDAGLWARADDVPAGRTFYRHFTVRVLEGGGYGGRMFAFRHDAPTTWTCGTDGLAGKLLDMRGAYSNATDDSLTAAYNLLAITPPYRLPFSPFKRGVRAAANVNIDIVEDGLVSIDGVTLADGDRVLLMGQTVGSENGLYVAHPGPWARTLDAVGDLELADGLIVPVLGGTSYGGRAYRMVEVAPTVGTTPLTFALFGGIAYTSGDGIDITGSAISVRAEPSHFSFVGGVLTLQSSVRAQRYSATFGDGSTTVFTITHSLATRDLTWGVREAASPWEAVIPRVRFPTVNTVELTFTYPPASNEYRLTVSA